MGYTTDFHGQITVDPPLNEAERGYLNKFAGTRRMDRTKGPYFVDGTGDCGQGRDADINNYNRPPAGQPSLWCQWVPTEDGTAIAWDGGEKFYEADEWMRYLIDHFLKPGAWAKNAASGPKANGASIFGDHVCNGTIEAHGEDPNDHWLLVVKDNVVTRKDGRVVYD
jgi:hypothetical protein